MNLAHKKFETGIVVGWEFSEGHGYATGNVPVIWYVTYLLLHSFHLKNPL